MGRLGDRDSTFQVVRVGKYRGGQGWLAELGELRSGAQGREE